MPITQWPAGPSPVIISELATGVTDGKLETTSVTVRPRSTSAANVGATSSSMARISISGCIASTTTRTSFRGTLVRQSGCRGHLAEDPQALVFALGPAAAREPQPDHGNQHDHGERVQHEADARHHDGGEDDDRGHAARGLGLRLDGEAALLAARGPRGDVPRDDRRQAGSEQPNR